MSSATPMFEIGARALGYYGLMASWRKPGKDYPHRRGISPHPPSICITSASTTEEGAHEPAQSITITGEDSLRALRGVVDSALGCTTQDAVEQVDLARIHAEPIDSLAVSKEQVDAAARKLAELFDYPWDHMPDQGRNNMRKQVVLVAQAMGLIASE